MSVRLGASRTSSVSGLKVMPSTAIDLPASLPPAARSMRLAIEIFRSLFTVCTCSISDSGERASRAVRISAATSLGKQEPP